MSVHAESAERTGRSGVRKAERAEDRAAAVAGLDLLRAVGWLVLHDVAVPGEVEVPIDHVLAGPSGVYVINRLSAPGSIKMTENSLLVGGVSAYEHVEDIAAAALALREALDGRPVVPILCFQVPDEVAGVVAKVAICSTENILELLNGQPTVLDAAAAKEVMHKVGSTLERRSVARPMASVVDLPVEKPRHREKAKGRKRLLGFGRSDDEKNAAIVELTVAPLIERRREVSRDNDAPVEAELVAVEEAAQVEAAQVEASRVEAAQVEAAQVEAAQVEAAQVEAAQVEASRVEAEQVEAERLAAEEAVRLAAEEAAQAEAERAEAERLAAEEAARIEAEGLAADEAARLAAKEAARAEAERVAAEEAARVAARRRVAEEAARVEAERLAAEEAARLAADEAARAEAERLEAEEAARVEAERSAAEEATRVETERLAAEKVARLAAEAIARVEAARLAAEEEARVEAEQLAAEEAARLAAEEAARLAADEAARVEAERLAAEEAARVEAERLAAEEAVRLAAAEVAHAEAERLAAEKAARVKAERLAAEEAARVEAERLAAEEAARIEAERLAAEEAERLAAQQAARIEAEQLAADEAARAEAERLAAADAARSAAERLAAEEAERAEAEWAAADEAAWAEAERIAAERLAARKASRGEAEYVDESLESFETVAAQPPQEPKAQAPVEPKAQAPAEAKAQARAARPVVRQTRGQDQEDERPSAPPVGPAARRVDVKSAVKMVSAAFARRDDDLEFDLNELETAFKEETPERAVPAWLGASTPAAAKPAAEPVVAKPAKKRRGSLMPAIVGALVVAMIFGVAPRLSDAYEWGRSFFVAPAPPSLGETAVIAQTGSHPTVQLMAGIPLNVKSANGITAAKGQHLVGVPIQVMNQGNVKWTLPVAGGFKAVDTLGITHSPATKVTKVTTGKVLPKRLQLTPGRTVTGMVVFAVANGRDIGIIEVTLAKGEVASVWNAPESD